MLVIYPLLGVEAFERLDAQATSAAPQLRLQGQEMSAPGRETAEGFLVFAGAVGRLKTTPTMHPGCLRQRERPLAEGVLAIAGHSLRLERDHVFAAPSAAAAILLGRRANGRKEWKDESGRTLADIQNAALDEAPDGGVR
jgi:hypothetical protein